MAVDCAKIPDLIAIVKAAAPTIQAVGPTLVLLGGVLAWLANRFLGWCVWVFDRFVRRRDLMKALLAEIASNSEAEAVYYPGEAPEGEIPDRARDFIKGLKGELGPYKPLAPYVATVPGNPVYEKAIDSLPLLPSGVIKAIVAYYSASVSLTNQLLDFREDAFLKLSQRRQLEIIAMLWNVIGRDVERTARKAKAALRWALWKSALGGSAVLAAIVGACVAAFFVVQSPVSSLAAAFTQAAIWASACETPTLRATGASP
ncbi:hypothetical protein DFR50_101238 [Roseiarcus fermentans]|uniref:Uncharacterized protein n=1 Tax=Roseiarcus fermentans TaxID=1473586 RepID=A0A366FUE1_9HYPH|nr:hypothetical protein [Roseiarcus fermentans]RBP18294.1 hypothetical protein DFR50_101238 [Roseiarcus fermentans]